MPLAPGYRTPDIVAAAAPARQSAAPPGYCRQKLTVRRQQFRQPLRQLRLAKARSQMGRNLLPGMTGYRRQIVGPGDCVSGGCAASQSPMSAIRRRPRCCAGSSRPGSASTSQNDCGRHVSCHCNSRFPVRQPPNCTTISARSSRSSAAGFASQISAQGNGWPLCDSTSPISGQPRALAHRAICAPAADRPVRQ